jgi:hypothetical protein
MIKPLLAFGVCCARKQDRNHDRKSAAKKGRKGQGQCGEGHVKTREHGGHAERKKHGNAPPQRLQENPQCKPCPKRPSFASA